nr:DUF4129 domain-containing protein [Flexivirga aerilata]
MLLPALLLLAGVVTVALTQLRRRGRTKRAVEQAGVLADTTLTADQLRRRAEQAQSEGDLRSATLDLFRAIARAAEERALIVPRPGRTAHEVGAELSTFFPSQRDELRSAANLFDRVRYGGATATDDDATRMRALDAALTRTRPQHTVTHGAPA